MQGNQIYGFRKSGYLLKKSEGKMRVKAWRKRRCEIVDGNLLIYHSDEAQPPTKLNLLTCQVKLVPGKEKKCFDLISFNRTYHFQVEDEHDITAWVYVLINCKEGALKKQFDDPNSNKDFVDFVGGGGGGGNGGSNNTSPSGLLHSTTNIRSSNNNSTSLDSADHDDAILHRLGAEHQLQQQLIRQVQALTGNDRCVDCSTSRDVPTWLSTNLGVLVCIECSGIHRDLGVHISRIQSLTLDNINTSQLLIAHNMGNDFFNEIMESRLRQLELLAADLASPNFDTPKLKPNSTMEQRCEFIKAKYIQKKFCQNIHRDDTERAKCLKEAVISKDLRKLVQLFGEGFDIASCISNLEDDFGLDNNSQQYSPQSQTTTTNASSTSTHNYPHDCQNSNNLTLDNHYQNQHYHQHQQQYQHQQMLLQQQQNNLNQTQQQQQLQQQNNHNQTQYSAHNTSVSSNLRVTAFSQHNSMDDSIDTTVYQPSKPVIQDLDTSIHLALSCQASRDNASVQFECDLFILDFIIQNSRAINKQNALGETPLHYCAKFNLPECMKLLIRSGADLKVKNNQDETPLDVVQNLKPNGYKFLVEILGGSTNDHMDSIQF